MQTLWPEFVVSSYKFAADYYLNFIFLLSAAAPIQYTQTMQPWNCVHRKGRKDIVTLASCLSWLGCHELYILTATCSPPRPSTPTTHVQRMRDDRVMCNNEWGLDFYSWSVLCSCIFCSPDLGHTNPHGWLQPCCPVGQRVQGSVGQ